MGPDPSPGEALFPFETGACFPRGTLVHTHKGPAPIEQIKVGDLVLSKSEMTGKVSCKPVVTLFQRDDEEIVALSYEVDGETDGYYTLHPTGNHLFWVVDEGWRRADRIEGGERLALVDDRMAAVLWCVPVYRTREAGVGWYAYDSLNDHEGVELDFGHGPVFARDGVRRDVEISGSDDPLFRGTVYNFVVADDHTYFVGESGVWVHDCSEPPTSRHG